MKFKKTLKEEFTSNDLHKILEDYIYDRLEAAIDNLAILASNDIEEYDADYCSDNVDPKAVAHLSRASEALADELLRYAPAIIHESLEEAYQDKLYKRAEGIADDISEFLDETSRIEDLSDYLDKDDLDHLGKSMDALYYFAHSYSYNESLQEGSVSEDVRIITTGLSDKKANEMLHSVIGQMSDGIWENSSSMNGYWMFANVSDDNNILIDNKPYAYNASKTVTNKFAGMDDDKVKKFFANKIKTIVRTFCEDNDIDFRSAWNEDCDILCDYINYHEDISIGDAFKVYKALSRKIESLEEDIVANAKNWLIDKEGKTPQEASDIINTSSAEDIEKIALNYLNKDKSLKEDANDFYKDEASVEFDDTAFVGKPLKDFLRTIDHRTKINISSDDGYDAIGGKGDTAGMSGLAHDAGWYLADKIVKGIKVPEDKRFYEYSIFIEGFNQEEE